MPDKPEVVQMAARLRIDQDAVAGKLLRLFSWVDQNVIAEIAESGIEVTEAFIDRLTNKRGFESALVGVNWARREGARLVLVNFTRHNGETAKERAQTNRRVAELRQREAAAMVENATKRERNGNGASVTGVTVGALPKPLPEEEEDMIPPTPPRTGGLAKPKPLAEPKASDRTNPLEKARRRRRLPDLKTLRESLSEVKGKIQDLRFPGGCAHERRPEEMSEEKRTSLAELREQAVGLERTIAAVKSELAQRVEEKNL